MWYRDHTRFAVLPACMQLMPPEEYDSEITDQHRVLEEEAEAGEPHPLPTLPPRGVVYVPPFAPEVEEARSVVMKQHHVQEPSGPDFMPATEKVVSFVAATAATAAQAMGEDEEEPLQMAMHDLEEVGEKPGAGSYEGADVDLKQQQPKVETVASLPAGSGAADDLTRPAPVPESHAIRVEEFTVDMS